MSLGALLFDARRRPERAQALPRRVQQPSATQQLRPAIPGAVPRRDGDQRGPRTALRTGGRVVRRWVQDQPRLVGELRAASHCDGRCHAFQVALVGGTQRGVVSRGPRARRRDHA
jgi:hypothetical protein